MNELYSEFPDIEAISIAKLKDAGVCGGRVYPSLPADAGSSTRPWPIATVKRLGGLPVERHRLDRARIQVDVFGNTKAEARDQAEIGRRMLLALEGTIVAAFNGVVTAVDDELGLTFLPDPETNRDRYVFAMAVYAHHWPNPVT